MRLASFGVFALLALVAATATGQQQTGPKDLLIGTWVYSDKKGDNEYKATVVFDKDGNTRATLASKIGDKETAIDINARYKWVPGSEDTIEMTSRPPGAKEDQTETVKIKVSDKDLSISGKDGKDMKFTRSK
jgi:hypothetical protein